MHDDASEVLFDQPFSGGSDLHGRCASGTQYEAAACVRVAQLLQADAHESLCATKHEEPIH